MIRKNAFIKSEEGQGLVEYILVFSLIVLVVYLSLRLTGTSVGEMYCTVASSFSDRGCECVSTFDDPAELDNWEGSQRDEYLSFEDGKACNSGPNSSFLNSCSKDFGSSDFTANLNGISINHIRNGNRGFDFLFRSKDENNGYHFTYNSRSDKIRFWKRVKGKWILLSSKNAPHAWSQQEEINFQVTVKGNTFTAYKDGESILQATDDAYTEGQYGLRNKPGSKTCVGEIIVQQLPR